MAVFEFTTEEIESEEWRLIPQCEGIYEASNLGRIRHVPTKRIKKFGCPKGYLTVKIWQGQKWRNKLAHTLVAEAFIGACPVGKEVNHIDTNPANNRTGNLEYITHLENMRLRRRPIGPPKPWEFFRAPKYRNNREHREQTCNSGENHPRSKLSDNQATEIRRLLAEGVSQKHLAARFGVHNTCISRIKLGKRSRRLWRQS